MTGTEVAQAAKRLMSTYKYVYGANGEFVWKTGHVGIYIGNQTVIEATSEFEDVIINPIAGRGFTHCLLLPGIDYVVYLNDESVDDAVIIGSTYTPWTGKIVNTPVVVPQISPTNTSPAAGFGMKNNGAYVTVVGVSGDYYLLQSENGYYGYVYSYYIGTTSSPSYENQYVQWTGLANSVNGYVNIRTGPSTSYSQHPTIPSINNNAEVQVLGEVLGNEDKRLWYYVQILDNYVGYIRADLITKKVLMDYTAWIGEAKSTTGTINIRTSPTINSALSSLHAPLSNGDIVTVVGEARDSNAMIWYYVQIGGILVGYIRSDLILVHTDDYYPEWDGIISTTTSGANIRRQPGTDGALVAGSPFANGTSVHVTGEVTGSDGYTWYELAVGNLYGYCRCDLVAATEDYPNWWTRAQTTSGVLNVRKGAGTGYDQLAACPSVSNGTLMKVILQKCGTDGAVWYYVVISGVYYGYVKGSLTKPVNTPAYPAWTGYARSTTGVVNVRSAASTSSSVIAGYPQLNNGDSVYVFGQENGTDGYIWYHVRIMNLYTGYIRSDLLSHGKETVTPAGYAVWTGIANSTTGTVNVRAGAGTGTALVLALQNGDAVRVINTETGSDGYIWYQVMVGNTAGYIRSDLIIHQPNTTGGTSSSLILLPEQGK